MKLPRARSAHLWSPAGVGHSELKKLPRVCGSLANEPQVLPTLLPGPPSKSALCTPHACPTPAEERVAHGTKKHRHSCLTSHWVPRDRQGHTPGDASQRGEMYPRQQGQLLKGKGTKDNLVFIVITLQKKNTFCSLQKMCEGQICVFLFLKKSMLHELQCNQYLFFLCFLHLLQKGFFFFLFFLKYSTVR